MRNHTRRAVCLFFVVSVITQTIFAQAVKDELAVYNDPPSRFRGVFEKYSEDFGILNRFYSAQTSPNRSARFRQLYADQLALLAKVNFETLNHDEQVDYILFKNHIEHEQKELNRFDAQLVEMAPLMPFARVISDLEDTRRKLEPIDSAKTAALLNDLVKQIAATQKTFDSPGAAKPKRTVATGRPKRSIVCGLRFAIGTPFTISTTPFLHGGASRHTRRSMMHSANMRRLSLKSLSG